MSSVSKLSVPPRLREVEFIVTALFSNCALGIAEVLNSPVLEL